MIYLYALTGPLSAPPEGTGRDRAPLEVLALDGLAAVYSTHEQLDQGADPESYWAHEEAVEAVMNSQAVLPARFGTTFADVDELRAAVARDASTLVQRLGELEGCVELAVRIGPLTPEEDRPKTGRDYLQERLSVQSRREALAEGTLACLRELAVAAKLATQAIRSDTVSISYLVRVDEVDRFARAVDRLARRWPEFSLSCTGPWAPYSFTSVPTQADGSELPGSSQGAARPRVPAEAV